MGQDADLRAGLERLHRISEANDRAKASGGVLGKLRQAGCAVAAAATFARLYVMPVKPNALPQQVRMAPAW
jgi:magnesium-protoporphyrin IX monomethyl ester (oxidative) cyclase